ncbi:MAG: TetR/AcrR family transcriptional regulator [Gaiellaceae bacterium]
MKKPPNPRPDTRARILEAALDVFSEYGFEGSSLQQIADRLGLTKAALYYHFRSKDELLEALVEPAVKGVDEILDACSGERDTPARRKEFMKQYLDYFLRQRRLIAYITRDLATLAHPAISAGNEERRARVEAILAGSDLDFSDQVRVTMAFGGMQAAIAQYPDADEAELREALLEAGAALLRPRRGPTKKLQA